MLPPGERITKHHYSPVAELPTKNNIPEYYGHWSICCSLNNWLPCKGLSQNVCSMF